MGMLEKRLKAQAETVKSLNSTVDSWKTACVDKDEQIKDLNEKLEKLMRDQAYLEEQIAEKRREIELRIAREKELLEAQQELTMEADNARAVADGMEKASSRLSRELVKVHEQYGAGPPKAAPAEVAP